MRGARLSVPQVAVTCEIIWRGIILGDRAICDLLPPVYLSLHYGALKVEERLGRFERYEELCGAPSSSGDVEDHNFLFCSAFIFKPWYKLLVGEADGVVREQHVVGAEEGQSQPTTAFKMVSSMLNYI